MASNKAGKRTEDGDEEFTGHNNRLLHASGDYSLEIPALLAKIRQRGWLTIDPENFLSLLARLSCDSRANCAESQYRTYSSMEAKKALQEIFGALSAKPNGRPKSMAKAGRLLEDRLRTRYLLPEALLVLEAHKSPGVTPQEALRARIAALVPEADVVWISKTANSLLIKYRDDVKRNPNRRALVRALGLSYREKRRRAKSHTKPS